MSEIATLAPLTPEETEARAQLLEAAFEPKRKPSNGSRVTPERKATIYALADAAHLNPGQIAQRLDMDWRTVKAVLDHREGDGALARNLLGSNALGFVKDWITAGKVGARKGRHEPARDALYALNVVSPPQQSQSNQSVTVILSGGDLPNELRVGIQQVSTLSPAKSE